MFQRCSLWGWGSSLLFLVCSVFLWCKGDGFCQILFLYVLQWPHSFWSFYSCAASHRFPMLNQPCILGVNSAFSQCVLLFRLLDLAGEYLLRVSHLCPSEILVCNFPAMSLFVVVSRYWWPHRMSWKGFSSLLFFAIVSSNIISALSLSTSPCRLPFCVYWST